MLPSIILQRREVPPPPKGKSLIIRAIYGWESSLLSFGSEVVTAVTLVATKPLLPLTLPFWMLSVYSRKGLPGRGHSPLKPEFSDSVGACALPCYSAGISLASLRWPWDASVRALAHVATISAPSSCIYDMKIGENFLVQVCRLNCWT